MSYEQVVIGNVTEETHEKTMGLSNEEETKVEEEEQPKLYANKYKTPEDLEKAYMELQKLASRKGIKQEEKQEEKEKPNDLTIPNSEDQAKETVEKMGLDFSKYQEEFTVNGSLTDESYQEFESKGIPKEVVDAYIEGLRAIAEKTTNSVYEVAGGQESYNQMIQWASANLSSSEIEAFNNALGTGDLNQIKLAVRGLKASYTEAKGTPPKSLLGGYGSGDVDVFESWAQVTAAMKDPRYEKDPAYRDQVKAKLSRSNSLR